jgi:hypothetical protein
MNYTSKRDFFCTISKVLCHRSRSYCNINHNCINMFIGSGWVFFFFFGGDRAEGLVDPKVHTKKYLTQKNFKKQKLHIFLAIGVPQPIWGMPAKIWGVKARWLRRR